MKTVADIGFVTIIDVPAGFPDPVAIGNVTIPDDVIKYLVLNDNTIPGVTGM